MDIPIIAITGTKGKTTVAYTVSQVLHELGQNVLRVDTTGHYINNVQKSNLDDSKHNWGLVTTVAPGRYLYEFLVNPKLQENSVAVLESSLGSSGLAGMGYRYHQVGAFLNVYEDHLGSSKRLKRKADIAQAKQYIYERVDRNGWAVFNAGDPLVVDKLEAIPDQLGIKLLPCGLNFKHFDIKSHLKSGGQALTVKNDHITLLSYNEEKTLVNLKNIPWTFNGSYMPSVFNLLMSAGIVYAYKEGKWNKALTKAFEAVRLNPYGGRLTLLQAADGTRILADYAHEKVSLGEIAKLGRSLVDEDGKLIGVLRLAIDRTDELIKETAEVVAGLYDQIIVYDKIDGHLRKPKVVRSVNFSQVVGKISKIFSDAIKDSGGKVERIVREDEACKRAAQLAGPNDVVVYIVNDDIKRSIDFIKKSFKADFV